MTAAADVLKALHLASQALVCVSVEGHVML
jgi:hypothetical protein